MDLKKILGAVAPTLATAILGPVGGLAVQVLGDALGISEPTQEKIKEAFQSGQLTGEQIVAVKQAEQAFVLKCKELDIDLERIHAGDRASARDREVKTGDKTTRNLAYLIVGSFCSVVIAMLFAKVTVESAMAGALVGYLSAKAEQVVAYYFGSSVGSKSKDEMVAKLKT